MNNKIKVRLTVDLQRYAKGLVADTIGYAVGRQGEFSKKDDRFVTVDFPDIAVLDVLWSSLEILDEELLFFRAKEEDRIYENIFTIKNTELFLGPLGGFKKLFISYEADGKLIDCHISDRERALRIVERLKTNNVLINKHYN